MLNITAIYSKGAVRSRSFKPQTFMFPGGEVQTSIDLPTDDISFLVINADLRSSNDVMALLLLTDALRRQVGQVPIGLNLPYVPYARQDRVCNPGEALAAKVFCNLINAQGYASVTILDPHSDVVPALLDRVHVIDVSVPLSRIIGLNEFRQGVTFIAPDAGARKRVLAAAKKLGIADVRFADKTRCTQTGKIIGMSISQDIPEQPLLIVDDICDGGRTFMELAAHLRRITDQPLYLYVTHGIFSKGVEILLTEYERLFTTNDWSQSNNPAVTLIKLGETS